MKRMIRPLLAATVLAPLPALAADTPVSGPVATYWMSAMTSSGLQIGGGAMAMMAAFGGGNPNAPSRSLVLQLGSSQAPTGAAAGDHLPPAVLGAGAKLPLHSPKPERPEATPRKPGSIDVSQVKGRILIYWGCGAQAGAGQPFVIDLAKIAGGDASGMAAFGSFALAAQRAPSAAARSYGEWPNNRDDKPVPAAGSLVGAHAVRASYAPPIDFTLGRDQDFMAPIALTGPTPIAGGGADVRWGAVPNTTGYFASVMGAGANGDMVMWVSSAKRVSPGDIPDYVTPADAARLVADRTLMAPGQTSCAMPAPVAALTGGLLRVSAFGREANFSYPPKPADPRTPWKLEWATKVRYASTATRMIGMPEMVEAEADATGLASPAAAAVVPKKRGGMFGQIMRGVTEGAVRGLVR